MPDGEAAEKETQTFPHPAWGTTDGEDVKQVQCVVLKSPQDLTARHIQLLNQIERTELIVIIFAVLFLSLSY